jgi:hypothetical protein
MYRRILIAGLLLGAVVLAVAARPGLEARQARPVVKVGVYDSRAVALAFHRSAEQDRVHAEIRDAYVKAQAAKDEKRIKELENEGPWMQIRMHQQVFSTAGVTEIMARVSDALPGIAREAGVVVIVSKWEAPYKDISVELVDVTMPIVRLFAPTEQTLKIIEQMKGQAPIPFDKLPLDPMM